jgi:hypothetical protein
MIAFQWIGVMTYALGERSCPEHTLTRHKLHNTPMPRHTTDKGIIAELEMTSLRATPCGIPIALSSGVVFLAPYASSLRASLSNQERPPESKDSD